MSYLCHNHTQQLAFLINKGKLTFEKTTYTDLQCIATMMVDAIKEANAKITIPTAITTMCEKNGSSQTAASSTDAKKGDQHQRCLTTAELNDPKRIALLRQLGVGSKVSEKGVKDRVFEVIGIVDGEVTLQERLLGDKPPAIAIEFSALLKKFAPFKGELAEAIDGTWVDKLPHKHPNAAIERTKAQLYLAMLGAVEEAMDPSWHVELRIKPQCVIAIADICKSKLRLVPYVPISNIVTKLQHGSYWTGTKIKSNGADVNFYFMKPPQASTADVNKWEKDASAQPFFWVGTTADASLVNMVLKSEGKNGWSYPVLVNSVAVKPHDKLMMYKANSEKRCLVDSATKLEKAKKTQKS